MGLSCNLSKLLEKLFTYIEGIDCIFVIVFLLFIFIPDEKFYSSGNKYIKEKQQVK